MGYTTLIIAAQATVSQLRNAFLQAWPELHLIDETPALKTLDQFEEWSKTRRSRGHDTKAIYQDGSWAALLDLTMTLCADEAELASLSRSLGKIL